MKIIGIIFLLSSLLGFSQHSNEKNKIYDIDTVYSFAELMPEFIGGTNDLNQIKSELKLPLYAKQKQIYGKVDVSITVDTNGNVVDSKILKGLGYGCDEEALRVINLTSGKWTSAKKWGRKVAVKFTLPIEFKPEHDGLNTRSKMFYSKGLKIYNNRKYANALSFFKAAIDLSPKYIDALFYSGNCCFKMERKDEACSFWKKSIELGIVKGEKYKLLEYCNEDVENYENITEVNKVNLIAIDSTLYKRGFKFKDGAYRTFKEFKFNSPSLFFEYRDEVSSGELDLNNEKDTNVVLYSIDKNLVNKLRRKHVWGYCKDGEVFVLSNTGLPPFEFLTIDIFGGMMLTSNDIKVNNGGVSVGAIISGGAGGVNVSSGVGINSGYTTKSVKMQIVDYDTGKLKEYNLENFMKILAKDEYLYNDFMKLKGVQKKNMMFIYLKKYNNNHPFYIMSASYY